MLVCIHIIMSQLRGIYLKMTHLLFPVQIHNLCHRNLPMLTLTLCSVFLTGILNTSLHHGKNLYPLDAVQSPTPTLHCNLGELCNTDPLFVVQLNVITFCHGIK